MVSRYRVVVNTLAISLAIGACASSRPNGAKSAGPHRAGSPGSSTTECSGSVIVHVSNSLSSPVVVYSVSPIGSRSEFYANPGVSDIALPRRERLGGVIPDPLGVTHPDMYRAVSYTTRCEP